MIETNPTPYAVTPVRWTVQVAVTWFICLATALTLWGCSELASVGVSDLIAPMIEEQVEDVLDHGLVIPFEGTEITLDIAGDEGLARAYTCSVFNDSSCFVDAGLIPPDVDPDIPGINAYMPTLEALEADFDAAVEATPKLMVAFGSGKVVWSNLCTVIGTMATGDTTLHDALAAALDIDGTYSWLTPSATWSQQGGSCVADQTWFVAEAPAMTAVVQQIHGALEDVQGSLKDAFSDALNKEAGGEFTKLDFQWIEADLADFTLNLVDDGTMWAFDTDGSETIRLGVELANLHVRLSVHWDIYGLDDPDTPTGWDIHIEHVTYEDRIGLGQAATPVAGSDLTSDILRAAWTHHALNFGTVTSPNAITVTTFWKYSCWFGCTYAIEDMLTAERLNAYVEEALPAGTTLFPADPPMEVSLSACDACGPGTLLGVCDQYEVVPYGTVEILNWWQLGAWQRQQAASYLGVDAGGVGPAMDGEDFEAALAAYEALMNYVAPLFAYWQSIFTWISLPVIVATDVNTDVCMEHTWEDFAYGHFRAQSAERWCRQTRPDGGDIVSAYGVRNPQSDWHRCDDASPNTLLTLPVQSCPEGYEEGQYQGETTCTYTWTNAWGSTSYSTSSTDTILVRNDQACWDAPYPDLCVVETRLNLAGGIDFDDDGLYGEDTCAVTPNPENTDSDGDGDGDACDGFIASVAAAPSEDCGLPCQDTDGDGLINEDDADDDDDGVADDDDVCPYHDDPDQEDSDGDGHGDACDPCTSMEGLLGACDDGADLPLCDAFPFHPSCI